MRPYDQLTRTGQRRRIGRLARLALRSYDIADARLTFLSDTSNSIFRVDTPHGSYALRVHPGHGRSGAEVLAELTWLDALARETALVVPAPVATRDGRLVQLVELPGVPGPRHVVLFRWLQGQLVGERVSRTVVAQAGKLMASLHQHAARFALPEGLWRDIGDWRGMGSWEPERGQIRAMLSAEQQMLCAQAAAASATAIARVDPSRDAGIIHSDLHFFNCLLTPAGLGAIDFDDCQIAPFSCDIAITLSYLDIRRDYPAMRAAFFDGYAGVRPPPGDEAEIEAFMVERGLRMIRWMGGWPSVDHFPFGRAELEAALWRCRRYLA